MMVTEERRGSNRAGIEGIAMLLYIGKHSWLGHILNMSSHGVLIQLESTDLFTIPKYGQKLTVTSGGRGLLAVVRRIEGNRVALRLLRKITDEKV